MSKVIKRVFEKENVDAAVIACNSATASGIEILREKFSFPIFGIEPFVNILSKRPELRDKKIHLLTTKRTAESKKFHELQAKCDPENLIEVHQLIDLLADQLETVQNNQTAPR